MSSMWRQLFSGFLEIKYLYITCKLRKVSKISSGFKSPLLWQAHMKNISTSNVKDWWFNYLSIFIFISVYLNNHCICGKLHLIQCQCPATFGCIPPLQTCKKKYEWNPHKNIKQCKLMINNLSVIFFLFI